MLLNNETHEKCLICPLFFFLGSAGPTKVQPRAKYVAWFFKSKCTKYNQNVLHMVENKNVS